MPDPLPSLASFSAGAPLRVLVVGADGFIGRAVSAALVRRGHRVIAAVRGALDTLHAEGPAELFIACASAGIGRVVQLTALGADD